MCLHGPADVFSSQRPRAFFGFLAPMPCSRLMTPARRSSWFMARSPFAPRQLLINGYNVLTINSGALSG